MLLYQEGERVGGRTDRAGLLRLNEPETGDKLVALKEVWRQPTARQEHNEWANIVYLTNLDLDNNGKPHPDTLDKDKRKQDVTLSRDNTLILFNILVSVEWDADETYLTSLSKAFAEASTYLYDVTDGQMAFGEVHIFDRSKHWADADFQISTKNTVRPYAYVGGIVSEDTAHAIRVGRFWNGGSGNEGDWTKEAGYRTLVHEFGHYALHLYDEYFMRIVEDGHFTGQKTSACIDLEIANPDTEEKSTNASIMYYQYKASELAGDDRWFTPCKNTEQQRVNDGSDWSTIVKVFGDKNNPPRWFIRTPTSRGSVMGGPTEFPSNLLPLPKITIDSESLKGKSERVITVLDQEGASFPNALVALYTTPEEYTIAIDQGLTDQYGQLAVYGAVEGDTIQAASLDGAYAGAAYVDENPIHITFEQTGPGGLQSADGFSTPYLNLVPTSDGDSLILEVHGAPRSSIPLSAIVIPDEGAGSPQSTSLAHSSSHGVYTGGVSFVGVGLGSGEVRVSGTPGGQWVSINANYNLLWVGNNQSNELASEDGNLQLYVDPGSLPSANAYATVLPTGYVPAPLPDGKHVLASAYNVRFSGSMTGFKKPALLKLIYHPDVVGPAEDLTIYFWNAAEKRWQVMGGEANMVENGLTVPITQLGVYVLGGKVEFVPARILLPVISSQP